MYLPLSALSTCSTTEQGKGHLQDAYNRFKALEGRYIYPAILKMKLVGIEKRMKKQP